MIRIIKKMGCREFLQIKLFILLANQDREYSSKIAKPVTPSPLLHRTQSDITFLEDSRYLHCLFSVSIFLNRTNGLKVCVPRIYGIVIN